MSTAFSLRIVPLGALLSLLVCNAAGQTQTGLTIQPRGAYASGTQRVFQVGNTYHFLYHGTDEDLEYVIDLGDSFVRGGGIRIREVFSDSYPIYQGGLAWRTAGVINDGPLANDGVGYLDPLAIYSTAVLYGEYLDPIAHKLTLKYEDLVGGISARKTYEFWLAGKTMKVHATADAALNQRYIGNYAFFNNGPFNGPLNSAPKLQQIPFMDNVNLVSFKTGSPLRTEFFAAYPDWYASNGSTAEIAIRSPASSASVERFYPMLTLQGSPAASNVMLSPFDETMNVTVSQFPAEIFPVPPHYRSPCYQMAAGRMWIFGSAQEPGSWKAYASQYNRFQTLGMSDLSILQWGAFPWADIMLTPFYMQAGVMGCELGALANIAMLQGLGQDASTPPLQFIDPIDAEGLAEQAVNDAWLGAPGISGLVPAATGMGALFAHAVVHEYLDQWGIGDSGASYDDTYSTSDPDYPASIVGGLAGGYPIAKAFSRTPWNTYAYGLKFPTHNRFYDESNTTRSFDGHITGSWDFGVNFNPPFMTNFCSWQGYALLTGHADAIHVKEHLDTMLAYGKTHYSPSAVLFDASGVLPSTHAQMSDGLPMTTQSVTPKLDGRTGDVDHTHTTRDYLTRTVAALRDVRREIGGPIYGEPYYWRWAPSYDYGARDGFRLAISELDNNSVANGMDGLIIPDYALGEILPKASGNSGSEEHFHDPNPLTYPLDGAGGDTAPFLDSYVTTLATYGLNPFATTNGDFHNNYWTWQGMIRSYATLSPVARRIHEAGHVTVSYLSGSQYLDLAHAIEANVDFYHPKIRLECDNGLVLYANHALSTWSVTVPKTDGSSMQTVNLQPDGFAAGDGSQLFVFYNAIPSGSGEVFDYVKYVDRWEMLNYRRSTNDQNAVYTPYDGFPSQALWQTFPYDPANNVLDRNIFDEGLVMLDVRSGRAIGASGGLFETRANPPGWYSGKVTAVDFAPIPLPHNLVIVKDVGVDTLYTSKSEGLVARLTNWGGSWLDVTTLASWTATLSPPGGTITIKNGLVTADDDAASASATITVSYGAYTGQISLPVVLGAPTASTAPATSAAPGAAVAFDASISSDPKHGPLSYLWNFNSSSSAGGARVSHVYTTPSAVPYSTNLSIADVEGNDGAASIQTTVAWPESYLWAHSFDDGTLSGLSSQGGRWGVWRGSAWQSKTVPGTYQLTVSPTTWLFTSTGAGVSLPAGFSDGPAGVFARKPTEAGAPNANRTYNATLETLSSQPTLKLRKGNTVLGTATLPGLDLTRLHDVRLVSAPSGLATRLRVYLDGVKKFEATDSSSIPGQGYGGIWVLNRPARFEDLRVNVSDAPYISVYPMELDASSTHATFVVDDQDLYPNVNDASLTLTIRAEDGPSAGQVIASFSGEPSVFAQMSAHAYESPNNEAASTWQSMTLSRSIEWYMNSLPGTNAVSFELVASDQSVPPKSGRKYVRYQR